MMKQWDGGQTQPRNAARAWALLGLAGLVALTLAQCGGRGVSHPAFLAPPPSNIQPSVSEPSFDLPAAVAAGGIFDVTFVSDPGAPIVSAELTRTAERAAASFRGSGNETFPLSIVEKPTSPDWNAVFSVPRDLPEGLWDAVVRFRAAGENSALVLERAVWSYPEEGPALLETQPDVGTPNSLSPAIAPAGGSFSVVFNANPQAPLISAKLVDPENSAATERRLRIPQQPSASPWQAVLSVPEDIPSQLWSLRLEFLASGENAILTLESSVWTTAKSGPPVLNERPTILSPSVFLPHVGEPEDEIKVEFESAPEAPIVAARLYDANGEMEEAPLVVASRPTAATPSTAIFLFAFEIPTGLWSLEITFLASGDNVLKAENAVWIVPEGGPPAFEEEAVLATPVPEAPALAPSGESFGATFADDPGAPVLYAELKREDGAETETVRLGALQQPEASPWRVEFAVPEVDSKGPWDLEISFLAKGDNTTLTVEDAVWTVPAAEDGFDFSVIADYHVGDPRGLSVSPYGDMEQVRREVMAAVNQETFHFSLLAGDLTYTASQYAVDYPKVRSELDEMAQFPIYIVPGNHDLKLSGAADGFAYWNQYFGPLIATAEVGAWHIVGFNSYDWEGSPNRNDSEGGIKQAQYDWLMSDLSEARSRGKNLILFAHHCPSGVSWRSDPGEGYIDGKTFRQALAAVEMRWYLCGHLHIAGSHERDGVAFVNIGTSGSMPTDQAWGYTMFHAAGDGELTWEHKAVIQKQFGREMAAYVEDLTIRGVDTCEHDYADFNPRAMRVRNRVNPSPAIP